MPFDPDFVAAARRVLIARYSPAEPRIPSGPGGGQWTTGGAVATAEGEIPRAAQFAIFDYTDSGFIPINNHLRNGTPEGAGQAQLMRDAMRPLPADMTLYRGTTGDAFAAFGGRYGDRADDLLPKLKELAGKTITDAGFQSTSAGQTYLGYVGSPVRMVIHAPKGTPSIDTTHLARYKGEREVILDAGTRLAVRSVRIEYPGTEKDSPYTAGVVVDADVVP